MCLGKLLTVFRLHDYDEEAINEDFLCIMQAFLINFGGLASIAWTTCISFSLYQSILKGYVEVRELYEQKLKLFALGVPLIASIM